MIVSNYEGHGGYKESEKAVKIKVMQPSLFCDMYTFFTLTPK
jgi:hypothetical protein